jgi:hypothetical protein
LQNAAVSPQSALQANSPPGLQLTTPAPVTPSASDNTLALLPTANGHVRLHRTKPETPPGFPPGHALEMSDEEQETYMNGWYPVENHGPSLEINYLVSDELAQVTGKDPHDLKFQADIKAAYSKETSTEAIKKVFPGLDIQSKFHFGYRDYVPQGGINLSEKADRRQQNAALKGIAKHITRANKHSPKFELNSGTVFVVIAPLRDGMRAAGFAMQSGAFGLATDPETTLHEIGHILGAEHELANGLGFFGKFGGRTIMYPYTDMGLFPQIKFSDSNAHEMRKHRRFFPVSIRENDRHREIFHDGL